MIDFERPRSVPHGGRPQEDNQLCEPVPAPMANLEKMAQMCTGVNVFCTLGILQGY